MSSGLPLHYAPASAPIPVRRLIDHNVWQAKPRQTVTSLSGSGMRPSLFEWPMSATLRSRNPRSVAILALQSFSVLLSLAQSCSVLPVLLA